MASTDPSASTSRTGSDTDASVGCPLCEQTAEHRTDIYRHLMVNHRKSELSSTLVGLLDTETTTRGRRTPVPFDTDG